MRYTPKLVLVFSSLVLFLSCGRKSEVAGANSTSVESTKTDSAFLKTAILVSKDFEKQDFKHVQIYFDKAVQAGLGEEKLTAVWNDLVSKVGAMKGVGEFSEVKKGNFTIIYVLYNFEKAPLYLKLVFQEDPNHVGGLFFTPTKN